MVANECNLSGWKLSNLAIRYIGEVKVLQILLKKAQQKKPYILSKKLSVSS